LQLVRRVKLTLKGLITDENEKPLPKARIRLSQWFGNSGLGEGEPRITGADGRYELKDLYADAQYAIAADADGFGESQVKLETEMAELERQRSAGAAGCLQDRVRARDAGDRLEVAAWQVAAPALRENHPESHLTNSFLRDVR